MSFLKENVSMIVRLIITHIAMAVFGLVLFFWTNMMGDGTMLVAGILSAIFYAVMVYTTMWEYGAKDKPAIDAGRLRSVKMRGFFVSLAAEAIFILIAVVYFIGTYVESMNSVAAVCYTILALLDSCFTGIVTFIRKAMNGNAVLNAPLYILSSLLISFVSAFGYAMGTKELRIIPETKVQKK